MTFLLRKSIHGRQAGVSSSGGLIGQPSSVNTTDVGLDFSAQMWGPGMHETVSSLGSVLRNSGVSIVSSDTTAGSSMQLAAPVQGVYKEIHFQTTATASFLGTTSTLIKINTTLAETAAGGSTALSISGPATGMAGSITLRGLSATAWSIIGHTVAVSS